VVEQMVKGSGSWPKAIDKEGSGHASGFSPEFH
jgi:hypothetical protein